MAHHEAPKNTDSTIAYEEDGPADAFAAVAVIAVVVATICFWLHGMV